MPLKRQDPPPEQYADHVSLYDFKKDTETWLRHLAMRRRPLVIVECCHSLGVLLYPEEFDKLTNYDRIMDAVMHSGIRGDTDFGTSHQAFLEATKNSRRDIAALVKAVQAAEAKEADHSDRASHAHRVQSETGDQHAPQPPQVPGTPPAHELSQPTPCVNFAEQYQRGVPTEMIGDDFAAERYADNEFTQAK
ncbi:MAG: hypothetical protein FWD57_15190 [Polyangiaceae bacterium]|nr:hypothetical protein [Polyangiaceae bacterium]